MKKHGKPIERRTFLQDRFEILIKKQKTGRATFAELTELDEIVNRDPTIRYNILEEMEGADTPDNPQQEEFTIVTKPVEETLAGKIRSFISQLFGFFTHSVHWFKLAY
jgi:hypothetical protein